jgi:hypothetical protein
MSMFLETACYARGLGKSTRISGCFPSRDRSERQRPSVAGTSLILEIEPSVAPLIHRRHRRALRLLHNAPVEKPDIAVRNARVTRIVSHHADGRTRAM